MSSSVYVLNNRNNVLSSIDSKFFLIHSLFTALHSILLLGFVCYQFKQPLFLNSDVWVFVYFFLFLSFSVDFIYFYFHEKIKNKTAFYWLFLFMDAVLMTVCLSAVIPVLYPVLVFIYMLHIVSAGILGQYKGAFAQAFFISFLFSWILILNPEGAGVGTGESLVFSFLLNNLGFLVVAGLSGFFGHQSNKMQWSLKLADKVVDELGNLNELIVKNIDMGLFILDEEAFVIHSNHTALDILSLPSSFSAPVHIVFPELREYIVSNKDLATNRLEVEYQKGDDKKTIEIFISPIVAGMENKANKYLILFQDCTKIKDIQRSVQEKERFASIGRMAAGIAHELRNPLSSIGGSIQLLDVEKKGSAENKRLMDITLREISRLNKIIGDFLDYAKEESIDHTEDVGAALSSVKEMESININSILEELLDSVRVSSKWEHITHHYILKSHGLIQGQEDRFKQILWNIIKNACEAMEDQEKGQLEVETFDDNEWVVIAVKDTGVGIDDEDLPHIYEPFFSKKSKGTGLGMAITRKLVLLFEGHILYEKRKGGGTICTLRFPIQPNHCPGEMAKKKSA